MKIGPRKTRWARLHTKEGLTYEGILLGRYAGHYVFESCAILREEGKTELKGRVEIPGPDCRFVQVLK